MRIFTAIFGDRYAQKFGQALMKYFEKEDFPKELLEYPELNLLYCELQHDKASRAESLDGEELIAYLEALLAVRRKELDAAPPKSDQ